MRGVSLGLLWGGGGWEGGGWLTVVSMRSCTPADWAIQRGAKSSLVLRVRIHRYRPMIMLNMAEKVVMTAPSLSQARAWVMMPGRVTRKVTKTKMALAMPAGGWCQYKVSVWVGRCQVSPVKGNLWYKRFRAACLPFSGSSKRTFWTTMEKASMKTPMRTKRKSLAM